MVKNACTSLEKLQNKFIELNQYGYVVGLKTGTEIEDMGKEEISLMKDICQSKPLTVKIGGTEARRDMRECLEIGVDAILAPMVETEYALANFVYSFEDVAGSKSNLLSLAMNLETATGIRNLDTMIRSSAFSHLKQVTIGRGDLSASMNLAVADPEVTRVTDAAIRKIKNAGKMTSVGGGWQVEDIESVLPGLSPDTINTRHVVLENSKGLHKNARFHLANALSFEIDLYKFFREKFSQRAKFFDGRIQLLSARLGLAYGKSKQSA